MYRGVPEADPSAGMTWLQGSVKTNRFIHSQVGELVTVVTLDASSAHGCPASSVTRPAGASTTLSSGVEAVGEGGKVGSPDPGPPGADHCAAWDLSEGSRCRTRLFTRQLRHLPRAVTEASAFRIEEGCPTPRRRARQQRPKRIGECVRCHRLRGVGPNLSIKDENHCLQGRRVPPTTRHAARHRPAEHRGKADVRLVRFDRPDGSQDGVCSCLPSPPEPARTTGPAAIWSRLISNSSAASPTTTQPKASAHHRPSATGS